jgi:hypothetical protein
MSLPSLERDSMKTEQLMLRRLPALWSAAAIGLGLALLPAAAQNQPTWQTETNAPAPGSPPPAEAPANTTVVPRSPVSPKAVGGAAGQLSLSAFLTEESQPIQQGLVWRVYRDKAAPDGKNILVSTLRDASPTLRLEPGTYQVNVALGRANLTRKIVVAAEPLQERFVLNAGGLRVIPVLAKGEVVNDKAVSFDVQSDERDQHGQRVKVATAAKAGVMLRLNAGIYSVVSTYGDANAIARADVTVEAGKLTEVTLAHPAAKVTFKLVTRRGGDAIADTQWSLATGQGEAVRESSGALPTHFLAPGAYAVSAKHAGRVYRQEFSVKSGDTAFVEVVIP